MRQRVPHSRNTSLQIRCAVTREIIRDPVAP